MDNKRFVRLTICICVAFIVGIIIFSSVIFETNAPKIEGEIPTHWNLKDDLGIVFTDESGIKDYHLQVFIQGEMISDEKEIILNKPKSLNIMLPKPKIELKNGTKIEYKIAVTDWSSAHFFSGNTTKTTLEIVVDTTPPRINYIASSFRIVYGGSAVVAFEVDETALKDVYISNGTDRFQAFKYANDNIYISFIAWPLKNKTFEGHIIAIDKAGNQETYTLPMKRSIVTYRKSSISLKEHFLHGKLNELLAQIDQKMLKDFDDDVERFVFFNELVRQADEERIIEACDVASNKGYIDSDFVVFKPLEGYKVVGNFGETRSYFYNKEEISKSFHLGIDIASVKNAPIIVSNNGIVLLKSYLGLYGNTVLVYHGFGMSSIYSHMLQSDVKVSQEITKGTQIGRTGTSGWAFGDHLHFGILIQGHFVRLSEWLDSKWINENVVDVLQKATAYSDRKINTNR